MAKTTKKRRSRTAHTGVKLKQRANGSWVARWTDPLTGAETQESLTKLGLTTTEGRRAWAIKKAANNRKTRAAVASGHAVAERVTVAKAIERYLAASTAKTSTLEGYKPSLRVLEEWATKAGLRLVSDLQPRHLTALRDHVVKLPVTVSKREAKRGAKSAGSRPRAPATTRKTLTVLKAFLQKARKLGFTPHLDGDAIRERLESVKEPRNAVEFLRPPQVVKLLKAALRHDKETFALTREEHDRLRPAGTTPRYEPAAPLVLLSLLTGMRSVELIELLWDELDLEGGEIRLPASRVKTGHARTVTLTETPAAIRVLQALRLQTPGDRVFPSWTVDLAKATRRRLAKSYGAPVFTWQMLRRTCCAVLTNAPGIYAGASAYRSAKRAGHSVVVAEKHYTDLLRDLPVTATTVEAALGIEKQAEQIVAQLSGTGAEVALAQ